MVRGTGVKGSGSVTLAHNATNKLAPITMLICRTHSKGRFCASKTPIATFAMIAFLSLFRYEFTRRGGSDLTRRRRLCLVVCSFVRICRGTFHLSSNPQIQNHGYRHDHDTTGSQDQKPPEHVHNDLG